MIKNLPKEIESLIDILFLSTLKQMLQEANPHLDYSISEYWTYCSGTYLWTEAFDKTVEQTGYQQLNDFWKNELNHSFDIDDYFDYFCIKAEKLGITHSDPNFYA